MSNKYTVVVARISRAYTTVEASSKREARDIVQRAIDKPETDNDFAICDSLVFDDNNYPDIVIKDVVLQKSSDLTN